MDLGLGGRTALVTGSSSGIGRGIAEALLAEGAGKVVLNGRDPARLESARAALAERFGAARVEAVAADVSGAAGASSVARALEQGGGRLDVLVCNVGSGRSVPAFAEDDAEWERMARLNLRAATGTVQACRGLLAAARGAIVCISSICGVEALGCPPAYGAMKAALNHWVAAVSRPLAREGVRINAVAPGNVLFPGSVWERKLAEDTPAVKAMLAREVALGRLGAVEEIADWVCFLASGRAAFATGQVFVVDGGQVRS